MSLNNQEGLSELGLIWLENFARANVAVDNLRTCKMTAESIVGPAVVGYHKFIVAPFILWFFSNTMLS